jgi:hypothetical protein
VADVVLRETVRTRLLETRCRTGGVEEYLHEAVDCVGELIGAVNGSYTLCTVLHDHPYTVATTDRDGWQADQIEFDAADGPCYEALSETSPFPVSTCGRSGVGRPGRR